MSLEDRIREEFLEGLKEGFAGKPMEFPEGIRELGEFHREIEIDPGSPQVSPSLDDEVVDAEIIEE